MPCALTEIEPPTEKMSVDCIACTAKRGWSWRWMSCQVAPLCTVTTRRSASSWMRLKARMSSSTAPGANAWPPMLWRTPATDTFNPASRAYASAARTSSSLRTATTPWTGVRLRQLASFTVPPRCVHGNREASTTGAAVAADGSAFGAAVLLADEARRRAATPGGVGTTPPAPRASPRRATDASGAAGARFTWSPIRRSRPRRRVPVARPCPCRARSPVPVPGPRQ